MDKCLYFSQRLTVEMSNSIKQGNVVFCEFTGQLSTLAKFDFVKEAVFGDWAVHKQLQFDSGSVMQKYDKYFAAQQLGIAD